MKSNYITTKLKIMKQMGINDTQTIKAQLKKETEGMTNIQAAEIRIDNICKSIIQNYLNGDRTYVTSKRKTH